MKKIYLFLFLTLTIAFTFGQKTIHVPGDYQTIQGGINAANNGDTVLVAEGTYVENIFFSGKKITVASQYLIDGKEEHIENTIIDGSSAAGEEFASVVHFNFGEDTTSTLMGFTLINGGGYQNRMGAGIFVVQSGARIIANRIIGNKLVSSQSFGAGIYASSFEDGNDYHIIIEDNLIEGDSAYSTEGNGAFGGGIYIQSMYARIKGNEIKKCLTNGGEFCVGAGIAVYGYYKHQVVEIVENEIYKNKCRGSKNIGGGIFVYNCIALILDNHIYSNVSQGDEEYPFHFAKAGGIALDNINEGTIVSGNLIEKNKCKNKNMPGWGGGLEIFYDDSVSESRNNVVVDGNTLRKNVALWGAGSFAWRANVSYTNNFFDDNYAQEFGGGIYFAGTILEDVTIRVINNTFVSNASVSSGASIYNSASMTNNIFLMNNLFWDNLGANEINVGQAIMEIYHCNINTEWIGGDWEGGQNLWKDPYLNSGCVLNSSSPCKNRGIQNKTAFGSTFYAPMHDIRRISRPQGGNTDVGAYEIAYGKPDTLDFQDLARLYRIYIPGGPVTRKSYPLVINLHGEGDNAQDQMDWTAMNVIAEREGFIVVYPEGVDGTWNTSLQGEIDDVGFINELLDEIVSKYPVDNDRIYVCGFSTGGIMASTLAAELSYRIVCFATVSGAPDYTELSIPPRKIPALVIHGTDDHKVDFTYAENLVNYWNDHNSATLRITEQLPDTDPSDSCTVEKLTYSDAQQACDVLMYKIIKGGHMSWPGAYLQPDTTQFLNRDIDANIEIWNFFKQYRLSDFISSVPGIEHDLSIINIMPNPFSDYTSIEYELIHPETLKITFYNQFGKQVDVIKERHQKGLNRITWTPNNLADGIYYFRLEAGEQEASGKVVKIH